MFFVRGWKIKFVLRSQFTIAGVNPLHTKTFGVRMPSCSCPSGTQDASSGVCMNHRLRKARYPTSMPPLDMHTVTRASFEVQTLPVWTGSLEYLVRVLLPMMSNQRQSSFLLFVTLFSFSLLTLGSLSSPHKATRIQIFEKIVEPKCLSFEDYID